jgi:phosphate/sulfate permease
MACSGGVQSRVVWQIVIVRVATLPATIMLSGGLFWLLSAGYAVMRRCSMRPARP